MKRRSIWVLNTDFLKAVLAAVLLALVFTGCAADGARAQVKADLEELRNFEFDEAFTAEVSSYLSESAEEDYQEFLNKVRDFDYTIIDSGKSGEDGVTVVTVRITTYNFAREYLGTWTQYLQENGSGEFSQETFYGLLMENFSKLELKTYDSYVDIECVENENGEWTTGISQDMKVRDAVLGGLITEIAEVAQID